MRNWFYIQGPKIYVSKLTMCHISSYFSRFSCFWIEVLGCENIAKYEFKTQGFLKLHFMIFTIYYGGSEGATHKFST